MLVRWLKYPHEKCEILTSDQASKRVTHLPAFLPLTDGLLLALCALHRPPELCLRRARNTLQEGGVSLHAVYQLHLHRVRIWQNNNKTTELHIFSVCLKGERTWRVIFTFYFSPDTCRERLLHMMKTFKLLNSYKCLGTVFDSQLKVKVKRVNYQTRSAKNSFNAKASFLLCLWYDLLTVFGSPQLPGLSSTWHFLSSHLSVTCLCNTVCAANPLCQLLFMAVMFMLLCNLVCFLTPTCLGTTDVMCTVPILNQIK